MLSRCLVFHVLQALAVARLKRKATARAPTTSTDKVSASLPQGYALSPLALILLLADTAARLEAVQNVIFLM